MKTLEESYSQEQFFDTLRYELCEIIYHDYKGRTFTAEQMLYEKKEVLNKIKDFIKKHPELSDYKDDNNYWYPYPNVANHELKNFYSDFYFDDKDGITYFRKEKKEWDNLKNRELFDGYDYLFDPVKIQFFIIAQDINSLDLEGINAKKIMAINFELFHILLNTIGDIPSYQGLNTLEHMELYIQKIIDYPKEIEAGDYTTDLKNMILHSANKSIKLLPAFNDVLAICRHYKLDNVLNDNNTKKSDVKKL